MSILIRDARPEELDEAAAVMVAAYEEYRPALSERAWEGYKADIADGRGRLPQSNLIVAVEDGRVLGAVTYYPPRSVSPVEGGGWPASWAGVRLLGVGPDARGKGVGRLLMDDCTNRARAEGAKALGLHTTELMSIARAMYERMGFERVPEYDFHPTPTFLVMAYRLILGV